MDTLLNALLILLPLAYLLAGLSYGYHFFASQPAAGRVGSLVLRGTVLLHLAYLVLLTVRWQQFPAVTVWQVLSVVAFAVALVYVVVEWHGRERSTGLWMVSLALLFQLLASVLAGPEPPPRELFGDPYFAGHVLLALIGYSAFAVAAAYGFLFLELYRELKIGRFSVFFGKLPPLEVLERMMTGALIAGFLALSGAVGVGFIRLYRLGREDWITDPMILFTLGVWGLYGGALLLRRLHRWQGRQTAIVSLAGLAIILVSLLTVNLMLTGLHAFL